MLFMGEEYAEPNPFQYFVSHTDPDLVEAVRKGRKAEFAAFHAQGEAPDPQSEETFNNSKLQWNILRQEPHQTMFRYYQTLIALRRQTPALSQLNRQHLDVAHNEDTKTLLLHRWHEDQHVLCLMNFSPEPQTAMLPTYVLTWQKLFDSADPQWNGPAAAPDTLTSGHTLTLQPESLVIYRNG
jgi:maltooligosyltrehalose trehalohydrolase